VLGPRFRGDERRGLDSAETEPALE